MQLNRKITIILLIMIGISVLAYFNLRPKKEIFKTATIASGTIAQEIAETGVVKKGEAIILGFKNSGLIESISGREGEEVMSGTVLATLDTTQTRIQLGQAKSELDINNIRLEKLKNGASPEEIKLAKTAVDNSQNNAINAAQALDDATQAAQKRSDTVYQSGFDTLQTASSAAYNAQNFLGLLQRTYFTPRDADSIRVWENLQKVTSDATLIKNALSLIPSTTSGPQIDSALDSSVKWLSEISDLMREVRDICESTTWRDTVSTADKNSLDTQRGYVIAALSGANSAVQLISSAKSSNTYSINNAQAAKTMADGQLKTAQEQLSQLTAPPRFEDIKLLESQVSAARANVNLLETQINDANLKAPIDGQIAKINKKAGEITSPLDSGGVISLIPLDPFTVEVDIYEEDIVKIQIGDKVDIGLAAIPNKIYPGNVFSIDTVEKIINGVVYYPVKISFNEIPDVIKPGMSADVVIKPTPKENILIAPESALKKKGSESFASVLRDGHVVDALVTTGVRSNGEVEIISGLSAGDNVIIQ